MTLKVEYDPEANAAYVYLHAGRQRTYASTMRIDDFRLLDVAQDGTPIGIDFMLVSQGVDLRGLPEPEALAEALTSRGITIGRGAPVATKPATSAIR